MIEIQRRPEPDLSLLPDSIPPILKRIYINRGITDPAQLETSARGLHSYQKLGGIEQAVELLFQAIKEQKRIIVVVILTLMVRRALHCRCSRCVCLVVTMWTT